MKGLSQAAAVIECILFLENRTLTISEISRLSHINEDRCASSLEELRHSFEDAGHGIVLEKSEEGYQFIPRTTLHERLKKTYGKKVDTRLSRAAVETLTIIAYNQPIKRREIDNIRGANSEDIVKRLRELDYIKIIDKTEEPGHPARYGTTRKFLYDFNLPSIADLPRLDREESERFEEVDEEGNPISGSEIKRRLHHVDEVLKESKEISSIEKKSEENKGEIEVIEVEQNPHEEALSQAQPILVKKNKEAEGEEAELSEEEPRDEE